LIQRLLRLRIAPVLVAGTIGASGCAAHQRGLAQRFIKPGTPSVKMDAPAPRSVDDTVHDYVRKVRELQAKAHPTSTLLPTLESTDPLLSKALLLLAMDDTPARHITVADAYRKAGVTDYAFRHYQRATVLEPCSAAGYDGMARLWRDWGRPDIALGDAYRAVYCKPQSSEVYNTLGTVMAALGQERNARDAYRQAIALDARSAAALTNLGFLELQAGHVNEAVRLCAQATSAAPDFDPARNNLALAYIALGNYAAATQVLEEGRDAVAEYNLGVLRLATGEYQLAAQAFDRAAVLQPSMNLARARAVQARRAAEAGERSNGSDDQR
jgi:Flp pilus assembly protein TadD